MDLAGRIAGRIADGEQVSDGERGIVADANRLLSWFGLQDTPELSALDQWHTMTLDQKRAFHEQFARGFELYALEGKAPSLSLQSVFQRFSAWLKDVYRSITQRAAEDVLQVSLTDEVRQVMDRMIATDEQIAELGTEAREVRTDEYLKLRADLGETEDKIDALDAQIKAANNAYDRVAAECQQGSFKFAELTVDEIMAEAGKKGGGQMQLAEADAGPPVAALDAGPVDPVVAADHAIRPVAAPVDPPPAPSKGGTSFVDDALAIAGPVGRGALGGIACLAVAWLLARARDRWGWLRKGAAGNAAATVYAALATFGAVVAVGGSVGAGLTAIGSAMLTGMALSRDPATARREAAGPGEEVPT